MTLRFGIMCRGTSFPAWQGRCIRELTKVPGVEPGLLVIDGGEAVPAPRPGTWARLTAPTALWKLYWRWLRRGAFESARTVDLAPILAGVPSIRCVVERRGRYSQYFSPGDVAAIRAHHLDFILRFSFDIIRGDVLGAARYGVWSYHHGDLDRYRGMPACFWEVYSGDPVTGVTLQRLTETLDGGVVLKRSAFKTVLKSFVRNRDAAFLASADLPARVCRDLLAGRAGYVDAPPRATTAPVYRAPTNGQMVRYFGRLVRNKIVDEWRWLFRHRQWCVGIVDAPIQAFLEPGFVPPVRWLPGIDRRRFLADPFGIRKGSTTTLLAEELAHAEQVGRIVAIEWPETGRPIVRRGVLPLPVHASYPFLVEHDGEVYCVPETGEALEVALYRAVEFPVRWERAAVLARGVAALDPSIIRYRGRWWMFFGVAGTHREVHLHAMHAPELRGPWVPHDCNPLKTDVRSTRPGGTPFVHEGVLYRPAQDGSREYGGALALNRVRQLAPDAFEEEVVTFVQPDPKGPYPAGVHTLSALGDRTLVDGQRALFVPALFADEVRRQLRRLTRRRTDSGTAPSAAWPGGTGPEADGGGTAASAGEVPAAGGIATRGPSR